MDANLLIKQTSWEASYQQIINNINQMRLLHEGHYDNVYYIEPEESIFTALSMSDMVVSDESSVMLEALAFGIPSVAVTDWMIPDCQPSRPACVPMDYVYKTKKADVRKSVESVLNGSAPSFNLNALTEEHFSNRGMVNSDIMNAIEYFTQNKPKDDFMKHRLKPENMPAFLWN